MAWLEVTTHVSRFILGGHKAVVRPDPIPNSAVKHSLADGSSPIGSARVGSRQFFNKNPEMILRVFCLSSRLSTRLAGAKIILINFKFLSLVIRKRRTMEDDSRHFTFAVFNKGPLVAKLVEKLRF